MLPPGHTELAAREFRETGADLPQTSGRFADPQLVLHEEPHARCEIQFVKSFLSTVEEFTRRDVAS